VSVASFPELERLVEWNIRLAKRTVANMTVPSPAYALGLWPGDGGLADTVVCIGFETRRKAMLSSMDRLTAGAQVWNVSEFDVDAFLEPDPGTLPEFASLERVLSARLRADGVADPTELVLNRVALALSNPPIVEPRTADFVTFVFNEDFGDRLRDNIEFAASKEALTELEAKGLLPARFEAPPADEWPLDDNADES
jgi:hypothetical protein